MNDFTVPKRRVAVRMELWGGLERTVTLFLAETAMHHAGAERLSDLLNGGAEFVPALEAETGTMTFLHSAAVMTACAPAEAESTGAEDVTIPVEQEVEVTLADGRVLAGTVGYVLPPGRGRFADHLNDGSPFLRLLTAGTVLLVNKRHVVRVAQVGD